VKVTTTFQTDDGLSLSMVMDECYSLTLKCPNCEHTEVVHSSSPFEDVGSYNTHYRTCVTPEPAKLAAAIDNPYPGKITFVDS